jgi:preprotein translocase subunit SecG
MQTVVIVIHLMIVLAMIGTVLLQKSEGGGLGMGGGGAGGFLSSRGTANVLTRTTAFLAMGFFLTSMVLSILAGFDRKPRSILPNSGGTPAQQQGGAGGLPQLDVPDSLRGGGQPAPPDGGAPQGAPQVPRSQ